MVDPPVTGSGAAFDSDGHGTHVAGSAAQCSDNGVGGAGMAPEASIMPVRVFSSTGGANTSDVAQGIDWAIAQRSPGDQHVTRVQQLPWWEHDAQ